MRSCSSCQMTSCQLLEFKLDTWQSLHIRLKRYAVQGLIWNMHQTPRTFICKLSQTLHYAAHCFHKPVYGNSVSWQEPQKATCSMHQQSITDDMKTMTQGHDGRKQQRRETLNVNYTSLQQQLIWSHTRPASLATAAGHVVNRSASTSQLSCLACHLLGPLH